MRVCVNTDFWGFFCPFRLRGERWKTFQIKQLIYRPNFMDLIFTQFQPCSRFQFKRKAARSWSWSLTTPMTYMPCSSRWGEWGGGVGSPKVIYYFYRHVDYYYYYGGQYFCWATIGGQGFDWSGRAYYCNHYHDYREINWFIAQPYWIVGGGSEWRVEAGHHHSTCIVLCILFHRVLSTPFGLILIEWLGGRRGGYN